MQGILEVDGMRVGFLDPFPQALFAGITMSISDLVGLISHIDNGKVLFKIPPTLH